MKKVFPILLGLLLSSGMLWSQEQQAAVETEVVEQTEAFNPTGLFSQAQAAYNERNLVSALDLFKQAADLGHPEAQYMYALMLYRGEGGQANYELSAKYYQMAAQQGLAKAQYNLSVLYYEGNGVARDDVQSYKWLYLSSRQNEPRACKMIPVADRNLSPDLKALALADLNNWGKRNEDPELRN